MRDSTERTIHGHGDGIEGYGDGIEGGGLCVDAFPPILDDESTR